MSFHLLIIFYRFSTNPIYKFNKEHKFEFFYYCFDRMLTRTGHLLTIFSQMTKKNASKLSCKFFLCPKQSIFSFRFIFVTWLHTYLGKFKLSKFWKSCCTVFVVYYVCITLHCGIKWHVLRRFFMCQNTFQPTAAKKFINGA